MAEAMLEEELRSSPIPELKIPVENPQDEKGGKKRREVQSEKGGGGENRSKTVQIMVPPKRQKLSQTVTAKQVIDALSVSVSQESRFHALSEALLSFGHSIECAHDEELATGADAVMTKHLAFLLFRKYHVENEPYGDPQDSDVSTEISQTCEVLELLYRGSVEAIAASFDGVYQELLPLLICIIDKEITFRFSGKDEKDRDDGGTSSGNPLSSVSVGNTSESSWENKVAAVESVDELRSGAVSPPLPGTQYGGKEAGDLALRKATKILGHFARVEAATQRMAHHPGLLSCLISVITFLPYDGIPAQSRLTSLWILGNLACNTENMVMMACQPGIINTLLMSLVREVHEDDAVEVKMEVLRSHSIAARALHNLCWAPENKIPMSENNSLIEALVKTSLLRTPPFEMRMRGVADMMVQARRHSVSALRQLASAPRRNKIRICSYQNAKILDVLTDIAKNDPDSLVSEKAIATIHALACVDTAEQMMARPELLALLKDTMLSDDAADEYMKNKKMEASGTLLVLERSISEDMPQFDALRELLNSVYPPALEKDTEQSDMGGSESSTPVA